MIHLTKIIATILVLLAIALGGYAFMLSRAPAPAPIAAAPIASPSKVQDAPTYPVVVASKALPAGQVIPADALRVAQLSINPAGAFQDAAVVAGRVPVFDLGEGSPLLEAQLVSGLALRVSEGERAIAVRADEVMGVGNKVQPGDFVDIFVMLKSDGRDVDRSQARLLLSRKRVLAFGSASVDGLPPKGADGKSGAQAQRAEAPRTAVLAVAVDEVNRLTLGESSGRLLLALRNPADTAEPDPKLFAELPTALQPLPSKPGEPRRALLAGLDKAQAGLTAFDFVAGGTADGIRRATAIVRPAAPPNISGRIGSAARGSNEVEVIRGERSETMRY
ncbi:Flp pilus assembly protein CpaB [Variovorax paradoxus]|uniref:Flp pilus assembly protein CpaB n=1 Tax=Variovorax paradoxus TaxID=34073 RepID=UPI0028659E71|nr:Flp pilus assembly protein CpaB [Variovorax paradoxus]MDR6450937.1 pilus assembly protein CpaB [Variovorax paradoxus]